MNFSLYLYLLSLSLSLRHANLELGNVAFDDDSRSEFGGDALGNVAGVVAISGSRPGTFPTILFRHSDHFVGTPLGGVSPASAASVNDVGLVLILATDRTSVRRGRRSVAVIDGGAFHRGTLMRSFS